MISKIREPAEHASTLEGEVRKMIADLDAAMKGQRVSDPWWSDGGLIKLRLMLALRAAYISKED